MLEYSIVTPGLGEGEEIGIGIVRYSRPSAEDGKQEGRGRGGGGPRQGREEGREFTVKSAA